MPPTSSPYSLDVGARTRDGYRDVTLKCNGRPFFSTTHREVQWTVIAPFYSPGEAPARAADKDFEADGEGAQQAYGQPGSGDVDFAALHTGTQTSASAFATTHRPRPPHEYLCVFHREELKDSHDRYIVTQPLTVCSAYAVWDGTPTTFVLPNVSPSSIVVGRWGVFIQGRRLTGRIAHGVPPTVEHDGKTYEACVDAWWMASPLVVKPLYLRVSDPSDPEADLDTVSFSPAPLSSQESPSFHKLPAIVERQYSPSVTPTSSPRPHTAGSPQPALGGRAQLSAHVLAQFSVGDACLREDDGRAVAVLRTASDEITLASTCALFHLDAMVLDWTPFHVRITGLSEDTLGLSVTVSEHPSLQRQVMFLSDSLQRKIHVIRLPKFLSVYANSEGSKSAGGPVDSRGFAAEANAMELLFTLDGAEFPLVLPCVRASTPAPVLVVHYPRPDFVAVLNPLTILEATGSSARCADSHIIATMPLSGDGNAASCGLAPPDCAGQRNAERPSEAHGAWSSSGRSSVSIVVDSRDDETDSLRSVVAVDYVDDVSVTFLTSPVLASTRPSILKSADAVADPECVPLTVQFPSINHGKSFVLSCVLETLEAAVGSAFVYRLEYEMLRRMWTRGDRTLVDSVTQPSTDYTTCCFDVLLEQARLVCGCQSAQILSRLQQPALPKDALSHVWSVSTVTAESIDKIAAALEAGEAFSTEFADGSHMAAPSAVESFSTLAEIGLATVGLHLLCESFKIQERLWSVLDPIIRVVAELSYCLGWEHYQELYASCWTPHREDGASMAQKAATPFTKVVPSDLLKEKFAFQLHREADQAVVPDGAPSLYPSEKDRRIQLLHGENESSAERLCRSATSFTAGAPPNLLRALLALVGESAFNRPASLKARALETNWPLLRNLPAGHPIYVANQLYDVYQLAFVPGAECPLRVVTKTPSVVTTLGSMTSQADPWWLRMCRALVRQTKFTRSPFWSDLCLGAAYPLLRAILHGRKAIGTPSRANGEGLPSRDGADRESAREALSAVVGRLDLVEAPPLLGWAADTGENIIRLAEERATGRQGHDSLSAADDGIALRLDFPQVWRDARLDSVQALFNTARPIFLPDHGEQATDTLKTLSRLACALPLGRGVMTMSTHNFKVRDNLPIPRLDLNGRKGDGVFVANSVKEMQPGTILWPAFHNGCAAGLRFLPLDGANRSDSKDGTITRHWVVYQTENVQSAPARAGLLLAAGVLGHLRVLQLTDIYSLLAVRRVYSNGREATTMAVMLGLSCSFRGSNVDVLFRCLSMHVQSLTPGAEEIDVPLEVQTCALVSIGILCQKTPSNNFLVDVFLVEMSRLPSDEHCVNRESYALAAGFSLGLLLLGLGDTHGIPRVEERLFSFLDGGRRQDGTSATRTAGAAAYKERNSDEGGNFLTRALLDYAGRIVSHATCSRVFEGDYYNTAVSGPAAVVALGLMYLKTENEAVAQRLLPGNRLFALQAVSPLLCLLRTTFAALVRWSTVSPTKAFIHTVCSPSCVAALTLTSGAALGLAQAQVQYLLMNRGHCIAGAVFALGFRYAGSMDEEVRDLILAELRGFLRGDLGSTGVAVSTIQRSTGALEVCISTCCVAACLVMAGTGDLRTFAVLQRVYQRSSPGYGSQMAVSMSIGLLFLGCGRLSLSSSSESIAALVMALYPVWPSGPEDNSTHLQILRHLYALSVVPRVLTTVDAVTNRPVSVPVRIVLQRVVHPGLPRGPADGACGVARRAQHVDRDDDEADLRVLALETPCLYPPSETIARIEVHSPFHYNRTIVPLRTCGQDAGAGQASVVAPMNDGMRYPLDDNGFVLRLLESSGTGEEGCLHEGSNGWRSAIQGASPSPSSVSGSAADHSSAHIHDALLEPSVLDTSGTEGRLLGWLRPLLSGRGHNAPSVMALLDNMKFLLAAQKSLFLTDDFPLRGASVSTEEPASLVSYAMGRAVRSTLEQRYEFLFRHGPPSTDSATGAGDVEHPLFLACMRNESWSAVAAKLSQHPRGTAAFPVDLVSLCKDDADVSLDSGSEAECPSAVCATDVERWLDEAAYYYFGELAPLSVLRNVLQSNRERLLDKRSRTASLLRLAQTLQLDFSTVQRLAACCVPEI